MSIIVIRVKDLMNEFTLFRCVHSSTRRQARRSPVNKMKRFRATAPSNIPNGGPVTPCHTAPCHMHTDWRPEPTVPIIGSLTSLI